MKCLLVSLARAWTENRPRRARSLADLTLTEGPVFLIRTWKPCQSVTCSQMETIHCKHQEPFGATSPPRFPPVVKQRVDMTTHSRWHMARQRVSALTPSSRGSEDLVLSSVTRQSRPARASPRACLSATFLLVCLSSSASQFYPVVLASCCIMLICSSWH